MKKSGTKRALFLSVLSIVLCLAMLMGSTFAWFTDSVSTGVNKIVAGNLDVELKYSTDGENWNPVTEDTNIFNPEARWEPGYTEVVYLKVANAGSLAFKYQFGINVASKVIGYTENDDPIDLSNFIMFGVVDSVAAPYAKDSDGRASAREAVKADAQLVSEGYTSEEGYLEKGAESGMIALVVYMPEETVNAANHGTGKTPPEIMLGINLVATQNTVESDSFDKEYDAQAEFPIVASAPVVTGQYVVLKNSAETIIVRVPYAAIAQSAEQVKLNVDKEPTTADIGYDSSADNLITYEITVDGIKEGNTTPITVSIYAGKGLNRNSIQVLYNNGTTTEKMEITDYDADTGLVTFTTTHFSEYIIVKDTNRLGSRGLAYTATADGSAYTVTSIGTCTDTEIYIPATYDGKPVTEIANNAFKNNTSITKVVVAEGITSIGNYAFSGCTGLQEIALGGVEKIGYQMCYNCTSLDNLVIPGSITTIAKDSFYGCTGLASLTISEGVTLIRTGAFYGCTGLQSVDIPGSVKFIENARAFGDVPACYVEEGVSYIDNWALKAQSTATEFKEITVKEGTVGVAGYFITDQTTSVTIADSVKYICQMAFNRSNNLTTLTIGKGVEEIGTQYPEESISTSYMITNYKLTTINYNAVNCKDGVFRSGFYNYKSVTNAPSVTVNIGKDVQRIPANLFYGNGNLNIGAVNFEEGSACREIGERAFYSQQSEFSIALPEGLTTVGKQAFFSCKLTSISLPSTVTSVGQQAFTTLSNDTAPVTYNGTQEQWSAVTVGTGNTALENIVCAIE